MIEGISLVRDGGLGRLVWPATPTAEELSAALVDLDALPAPEQPRRVEVDLDADVPHRLRWALHRHGFRLEGTARAARERGGVFVDVLRYARLVDDPSEDRARFTAVMNSVTARKRVIAHALVLDAAGRVLLCETSFKPDWELPGGIVELGEPPWLACEREMREEMGVDLAVGRLLLADWLRPYLGWEDALELVFDVPTVSDADAAALCPDGKEIVGLHWVGEDGLDERLTPFAAARTRAALRARATGATLNSEAGVER